MYLEAHGHSLRQQLQFWLRSLFFWWRSSSKGGGLGAVSVVFYVGQVDSDCLPHGFGRWHSDAFHGESLVGYWHHGQPMGPFKSREFGTGSGFMCIRIAWCRARKGPLGFDTSFGVSDAECCVSGAFFRTFPRVTMYSVEGHLSEETVQQQLLNIAKDLMGYRKPTATLGVSAAAHLHSAADEDEDEEDEHHFNAAAPRVVSDGWRGDRQTLRQPQDPHACVHSLDLSGGASGSRLKAQASRLPAAVRRKAQGFFKWRSDHQKKKISKEERYRECIKLVIDRMDPHLPNFGLADKTELHITVDAEQGLYVGGWVPAAELLPVAATKEGAQQEPNLTAANSIESSQTIKGGPQGAPQGPPPPGTPKGGPTGGPQGPLTNSPREGAPGGPSVIDMGGGRGVGFDAVNEERNIRGRDREHTVHLQVKRKVSPSQTKAKGLHQRLGHALQVKQNIKQADIRRRLRKTQQQQQQHHHHGERSIEDFLQETPHIRRQTCEQTCDGIVVRVKRPQQQQPQQEQEQEQHHHRHHHQQQQEGDANKQRRGTDILDPSNQLDRPFGWAEDRPELLVEGWCRSEAVGLPEALVFVHGYNTNDVQSMQIIAQMAAFGNFPSYIKPFLFTWPAGDNFLEFFDARENAKNPQLHQAFTDFMRALRDNGIRQVHLLAHSLGSRMLIMSLHRIEQEDLLMKLSYLEDMGEGQARQQLANQRKMHLVSLNFLNPEFYLEDFVAREYSFLRQYCSNISIFCDAHDGALWWSELFSGKQALGRSVFGLYARPNDSEAEQQQQQQQQDLKKPPFYASSTACFQGFEPQHMQADTRDWLDVDVIDMTWLGNNVHALRHSYWSLNREVIEDLRELIVTRKRARQRTSRLDRREGNVWVYRVAPSRLTSIFDSDI